MIADDSNTVPVKLHQSFLHVVKGDRVLRLLAEEVPMELVVTEVSEKLITCGPHGWTFDRETGIEEDPELGWGRKFNVTGSRLVKVLAKKEEQSNEA
jgi:hypothetical protein